MNDEVDTQTVRIVDVTIPFGSMVVFMIKWVLAAIPAIIILLLIFTAAGAFLGGFFGSSLFS